MPKGSANVQAGDIAPEQRRAQDRRFIRAMDDAISRRLEFCSTSISTAPGTRSPRLVPAGAPMSRGGASGEHKDRSSRQNPLWAWKPYRN